MRVIDNTLTILISIIILIVIGYGFGYIGESIMNINSDSITEAR
ncbi:hypothetical protein LCGC14_1833750 [marine sediment metagenome]|uniref:Uncharacterized protein n=1 Tax=marine sediment metagenome TaxID=412755 RepID=A0A0F9GFG5_9ZZZZ